MKIRREDSRNEDEVGPAAGRRPDSDLRSPPFSFFPKMVRGEGGKKRNEGNRFLYSPNRGGERLRGNLGGKKIKRIPQRPEVTTVASVRGEPGGQCQMSKKRGPSSAF